MIVLSPALERALSAYNREDPSGVVAEATEDVRYVAGRRGVELSGRMAWQAVLQSVAAAVPGRRMTVHRQVAGDDTTALEWTIEGTSSGAVEGWPPAGAAVRLAGCSVIDLRDGRIAGWRDYVD